ncbi:MAG: hypothetical protein HYZ75_01435 [Elusimicrobia bacterium]|nr:hypothetical protein [Elusimicrobiota bacterium]
MSTELLLAALVLAGAPVRADDGATALLEEALEPPATAYEGELSVMTARGGRRETRHLLVRFSPPDLYRRETLDALGTAELVVVSDGKTEWVHDRRSGTVWQGLPPGREHGLSDPDEERALLADNYAVRVLPDAAVAGRPCRVLEVAPRRGGPVVLRLWIDAVEGLVLQREAYEPDGTESLLVRFERVAYGAKGRAADFRFRPPAGARVVKSRPAPEALELEEAAKATDMKPRLAAWVPPGYVFESVSLLPYKGATILHYRWSDGVDVLSLFQAPARARVRPPTGGRPRKETVAGGPGALTVLPDGKALEWSAGDRFVLVGRLGLESLRRVAESVPR